MKDERWKNQDEMKYISRICTNDDAVVAFPFDLFSQAFHLVLARVKHHGEACHATGIFKNHVIAHPVPRKVNDGTCPEVVHEERPLRPRCLDHDVFVRLFTR